MSQANLSATDHSPTSLQRRSGIPGRFGRTLLGLALIFGACTKFHFNGGWHFRDYNFFLAMAIGSYRMLSLAAVEWLARIMPWFELTLGVLLLAGVGTRWVSLAAGALLVFMASMPRAAILGIASRTNLATELLVDIGFFLVALDIALRAFQLNRASHHQT